MTAPWTFIRSDAFLARASRLVILIATVAAIDAILLRVKVDLFSTYKITAWLFWSLLLNAYLLIEFFVFPNIVAVPTAVARTLEQPKAFVASLIHFAETLEQQGKVTTVLEIRDNMSHMLHLLGEHDARYKLGEVALAAAVQTRDEPRRAQILVDDLGWAAFMLNKRTAAENIRRGIAIAEAIPLSNLSAGAARLIAAKGYRHLAMMSSEETSIRRSLESARTTLKSLEAVPEFQVALQHEIARDFAQIDHAQGTLIMRGLGIEKNGVLPAADTESSRQAQSALELVGRAVVAFERVADYERLTKALATKERLLAGLGDETAALETRAQRDSVARLHSIRKQ